MERRVSLQSFEKPDIGTTFTTSKLILGGLIDWNILRFKSLIKHQNTAQHFIPQDRTLQPLQVITAAIILSSVLMISRELNRVTTFFYQGCAAACVELMSAVGCKLFLSTFFPFLCFALPLNLCLFLHHYRCEHGHLQLSPPAHGGRLQIHLMLGFPSVCVTLLFFPQPRASSAVWHVGCAAFDSGPVHSSNHSPLWKLNKCALMHGYYPVRAHTWCTLLWEKHTWTHTQTQCSWEKNKKKTGVCPLLLTPSCVWHWLYAYANSPPFHRHCNGRGETSN